MNPVVAPALPIHTEPDKRCSLAELAGRVASGDCVAIGGGLSSRAPMAVLRELVRRGISGLRLVGSAHGIDVDLLCGAGLVAESAESYVGFEQDFGMAPNYRRACEAGAISVKDSCCYTLVQQLRAASMGLPFLPIRSVRGTGLTELHPEFRILQCPFTGEELLLVPALRPDVAIIHAQYGDRRGNLRIEGPPVADILFAQAAMTVVATVERIVGTAEIAERGVSIPYFYVSAIAEVPMGAHPTACYPFYAYDRPHTADYLRWAAAGAEAFREHYLQPFVYACPGEADYLAAIGGSVTLERLASWQDGPETWKALYA